GAAISDESSRTSNVFFIASLLGLLDVKTSGFEFLLSVQRPLLDSGRLSVVGNQIQRCLCFGDGTAVILLLIKAGASLRQNALHPLLGLTGEGGRLLNFECRQIAGMICCDSIGMADRAVVLFLAQALLCFFQLFIDCRLKFPYTGLGCSELLLHLQGGWMSGVYAPRLTHQFFSARQIAVLQTDIYPLCELIQFQGLSGGVQQAPGGRVSVIQFKQLAGLDLGAGKILLRKTAL